MQSVLPGENHNRQAAAEMPQLGDEGASASRPEKMISDHKIYGVRLENFQTLDCICRRKDYITGTF